MNLQSTEVCSAPSFELCTQLTGNQYTDNKGFCEDLTEGKFSFPVVHGVRADPNNRQILSEFSFDTRR
jgi:geranylgeranyl pyrophosphate synthase